MFGATPTLVSRDVNGDGVIGSGAETRVGLVTLEPRLPVDYDYGYLSYSGSVNFRVAEPLSLFARYSRGARTNADRLLFNGVIDPVSGGLLDREQLIDYVKQAEAGVKYRQDNLTLNATGFWAKTNEHNFFFGVPVNRDYRTIGVEFEGSYRRGPLGMTVGATYTNGEITTDRTNPTLFEGNRPKNQPSVFFTATPSFDTEAFSFGAHVFGTTWSYARDENQLRMPGYVTVNPFVEFRPIERVTLSLNVNNVFDVMGLHYIEDATLPASGITYAQVINGRTISAALRLNF